jgi:hypothetical protein
MRRSRPHHMFRPEYDCARTNSRSHLTKLVRPFVIGAERQVDIADITHLNFLRSRRIICQPIVHAPNANRTPNASDTTPTR